MGVLCASFVLSNCSYFETGGSPAATIDVTAESSDEFQPVTYVQGQDAIDFVTETNQLSRDSIEVHTFERAAPHYRAQNNVPTPQYVSTASQVAQAAPAVTSTQPIYSDTSIDIYSLGGAPVAPQAQQQPAQAYVPIAYRPKTQTQSANYGSDKAAKIYFGHGGKKISTGGQKVLTRLATALEDTEHPIRVTGYASERAKIKDPIKRKIANLKTSMDRAFIVTRDLIKKGVPAENIETTAWGEVNPAPATGKLDVESASRRVEITSRLAQ